MSPIEIYFLKPIIHGIDIRCGIFIWYYNYSYISYLNIDTPNCYFSYWHLNFANWGPILYRTRGLVAFAQAQALAAGPASRQIPQTTRRTMG
jgi:hypothetical protein